MAFLIPFDRAKNTLFYSLEKNLHPWVTFGIMPLFAFANAGLTLPGVSWQVICCESVTLGIWAGLFFGKQVGIFSFAWTLVRIGIARLPKGVTWFKLWGVSIICGIGFTMSLFLGTLAFPNNEFYMTQVRLGVFIGSILSGIIGGVVLFLAGDDKEEK